MTPALVVSMVSAAIALASLAINLAVGRRAAVRARKPVLVFVDDPAAQCWVLRNVGNGPALNVLVAQRQPQVGWYNPVRVPPLGREAAFPLHWLGRWSGGGLGATYSDFEARRYTATLGGEVSCAYDGDLLPAWSDDEVLRYWNRELEGLAAVRELPPWAPRPSDFAAGPCVRRRGGRAVLGSLAPARRRS